MWQYTQKLTPKPNPNPRCPQTLPQQPFPQLLPRILRPPFRLPVSTPYSQNIRVFTGCSKMLHCLAVWMFRHSYVFILRGCCCICCWNRCILYQLSPLPPHCGAKVCGKFVQKKSVLYNWIIGCSDLWLCLAAGTDATSYLLAEDVLAFLIASLCHEYYLFLFFSFFFFFFLLYLFCSFFL